MRVFLTSAQTEDDSPAEALYDNILIFCKKKLTVLIRHAFVLLFHNCKDDMVDGMGVRVSSKC